MGYQESLVYFKGGSSKQFDYAVTLCHSLKAKGVYADPTRVEPVAVITSKAPLLVYPAGTRFLWVTGDRCFHNHNGLFHDDLLLLRCAPAIQFVPIEHFASNYYGFMAGISIRSGVTSENYYFRYQTLFSYLRKRDAKSRITKECSRHTR